MSRLKKTFAPRATRSEAQTNDHKEDETKYEPISNQDVKISLAKTEVTQITYAPFRNRAFSKIEKGLSRIKFPNSGLHVLALNQALNALGHKVPENETSFGEKTRVALINFQKKNGITGSGIFDKETLLAMNTTLEGVKDKKTKKGNKNIASTAKLKKPKTDTSKDSDSITYPIVIKKGQKFNGKLIQTDEDLNRFAEHTMKITRPLTWNPKFTNEYVKEKVSTGGTVKYKVSAKVNSIEGETKALSSNKRQFIRDATSTADYIQNIRILDLLKQLSDEEVADYKIKVSKETTDLFVIEESLKAYIEARDKDLKNQNELETAKNKLYGLEDLYKEYQEYQKLLIYNKPTYSGQRFTTSKIEKNRIARINVRNNAAKEELTEKLNKNGFKSISEFEKLIKRYEKAFEAKTVHIAEDALIKYRHILFEQRKKLFNDTFLKNLLEKIKTSKAKESYKVANGASTPIIVEKPNYQDRAYKNEMELLAGSKKAEGDTAIKELSSVIPLAEDNGFKKERFAKIETQQELRNFLENYINDQEKNITKIITTLHADQGLSIYGFRDLLQKSKEKQGIVNGSIFDSIIADKTKEESTRHIINGLLIGALAVALGLLSFGTGTVAVLLAAGNFALGAYLTYEEIDAYRTQLAAYKVDISEDEPSAVWVVISVVGSIIDAAAVAKISSTLIKAGRTFDQTKNISQTEKILAEAKLDPVIQEKVIKALEIDLARAKTLENKIQQNTAKHTKLKAEIKESLNRAKKSMFTLNSGINPEAAAEIIAAGAQFIKKSTLNFEKFLLELQHRKIIKEIEKLSPEELSLLRKAFEDVIEIKNPKAATDIITAGSQFIQKGTLDFEKFLQQMQRTNRIKEKLSPEELSLLRKAFEDAIEIKKVKDALKIEFLNKIGKRLPGNWDQFSPHTNIEFAEELKKYRGDYDLTFDDNFRGSEGQLFDIHPIEDHVLKRWYEGRITDMPKSIRKLEDAKNIVDSNPLLKQYMEVVEITEKGTDWIVRGFDSDSIPLKDAILKPKVNKIRQLMIDELSNKQSTTEQEILKKLNKNSANLHWSETNNKILIIDMQ